MSIATKTGDAGTTCLWSGERVQKDDLRVEAYGTIDELSAHLGAARHFAGAERSDLSADVDLMQNDLFRVAGMLATRKNVFVHPLREEDLERLESRLSQIEKELGLKGLVILGMTPASAQLDICRTVARRAERKIISLCREEEVPMLVRRYMNRVSDFLFLLARQDECLKGKLVYKTWE
ncbi:MAG: cob(I)yrinic acid a,c-diamide adenosyltransferase [Candidatus Ozemobacteraceae bacterium]